MADHKNDDELTGINITPFTDVVLVLLIIFMVAAPQIQKNTLNVKLPKASAGENSTAADGRRVHEIAVMGGDVIRFDDATLEIAVFEKKLIEKALHGPDDIFAVSADAGAPYQRVVSVLDIMRRCKVANVALRTEL